MKHSLMKYANHLFVVLLFSYSICAMESEGDFSNFQIQSPENVENIVTAIQKGIINPTKKENGSTFLHMLAQEENLEILKKIKPLLPFYSLKIKDKNEKSAHDIICDKIDLALKTGDRDLEQFNKLYECKKILWPRTIKRLPAMYLSDAEKAFNLDVINPLQQDEDGNNYFHDIVNIGAPRHLRLFLANTTNLDEALMAKNNQGLTPYELLQQKIQQKNSVHGCFDREDFNEYLECLELLKNQHLKSSLVLNIETIAYKDLKWYLDNKCIDFETRDKITGNTLLHIWVHGRKYKSIQRWKKYITADVLAICDKEGYEPLAYVKNQLTLALAETGKTFDEQKVQEWKKCYKILKKIETGEDSCTIL